MENRIINIGKAGEIAASKYLCDLGYRILEINYSKPYGEIDIIAKHNGELVFCEVKTSKFIPNSSFSPEFRINTKKLRNIQKTAENYLLEGKFHAKQAWRVDALIVLINENGGLYKIDHIQDL